MAIPRPSSMSTALPTAAEYYTGLSSTRTGLDQKFKDIDDAANYAEYQTRLLDARTRNFVLDFGNEDAWCAVDLQADDFVTLMETQRPKIFGTRWINIWAPEDQKESIRFLTQHYRLSDRLIKMMCTEPVEQTRSPTTAPEASDHPSERSTASHPATPSEKPSGKGSDLEGAYNLENLDPVVASAEVASSMKGLTLASIINQIWHFCSVDYGPRYTCIGYNSLYTVKIKGQAIRNGNGRPDGQRIWCWVILCDDGTIISMQENPFPGPYQPAADEERAITSIVRRNIVTIFLGASQQHSADSDSESLVTVRVRHFSKSEPDGASIKQEDGSSLVLYYIFDDWVSSYCLVARREHMYGAVLEDIREKMIHQPKVNIVDELHRLGRRLAVLKRLYESYQLVMTRLLQRQRLLRDDARARRDNPRRMSVVGESDDHDAMQSTLFADSYDNVAGVRLSSAAVGRFERLADRIQLYCLSEIDTCLSEKDSLTFMNFNLIALKDSQAVEKLTRITILLAKATLVFLPVSLMTAYFSTQIQDLQPTFTARAYWISFTVLLVLSVSLLALFGYASDTVEGRTIYQSLFRTLFHSSRRISQQLLTSKRDR